MSDAIQRLQGVSAASDIGECSLAPGFQLGAAVQRLGLFDVAPAGPSTAGPALINQLPYALLTQFSPAYWERLSNA